MLSWHPLSTMGRMPFRAAFHALVALLMATPLGLAAQPVEPAGAMGRLLLNGVERRLLELARRPNEASEGREGRTAAELLAEAERSLGLRPSGASPVLNPSVGPAGPATAAPATATPAPTEPPASPQRLDGWVLRVAGRSTVWVNGEPLYRFDQAGEARADLVQRGLVGAKKPARPGEALPGGLSLRPGQTWTPPAETNDLLPPGAVVIHRPGAGS